MVLGCRAEHRGSPIFLCNMLPLHKYEVKSAKTFVCYIFFSYLSE